MKQKYNLRRTLLLGYALGFGACGTLFCPPPPLPASSPLDVAAGNATITAAAFTVAGCCLTCLTTFACLSCCWSYQRGSKQVGIVISNDSNCGLEIVGHITTSAKARVLGNFAAIDRAEGRVLNLQIPWEACSDGVTDLTCGCLPWRKARTFQLAVLLAIHPPGDLPVEYFLLGVSANRSAEEPVLCHLERKTEVQAARLQDLMQARNRSGVFWEMRPAALWYNFRGVEWAELRVGVQAEVVRGGKELRVTLRPLPVRAAAISGERGRAASFATSRARTASTAAGRTSERPPMRGTSDEGGGAGARGGADETDVGRFYTSATVPLDFPAEGSADIVTPSEASARLSEARRSWDRRMESS